MNGRGKRAAVTTSGIDVPVIAPTVKRGPYVTETAGSRQGTGRPSEVLAENLRAYRLLRNMTQDQLASRMAHLCHGWGRSTVSAVEGTSRNVTIDELFGLAVSVGVTIGELLDPTGPDHTRRLSLDVGLREGDGGEAEPVAPRLAHLWAASRAVIRLWHEDGRKVEVELAEDFPALR
jgi:transcriptional regulator with XRE-family HTH domain